MMHLKRHKRLRAWYGRSRTATIFVDNHGRYWWQAVDEGESFDLFGPMTYDRAEQGAWLWAWIGVAPVPA